MSGIDDISNRRNLYGRRGSRLRGARRTTFDLRRDRFVALSGDEGEGIPRLSFEAPGDMWLEVGFGAGEHLVAQALANPAVTLIGCEHYMDGVASCFSKLEAQGVGNARVHHGDARDLMDAVADAGIARAFLLYPDPWPKARHHKRRFINPENLDSFARILRDGAHLRVASDIPEYIDWTREHVGPHPAFSLVSDTGEAWADWPGTRYEAKALREGRTPAYLTYERITR